MPLRNEPPRPPDGRPGTRTANGRLVGWVERHRRPLVAALTTNASLTVVQLVGGLVADWWPMDGWAVGLTVASLIAAVVGLVASRSGGRR